MARNSGRFYVAASDAGLGTSISRGAWARVAERPDEAFGEQDLADRAGVGLDEVRRLVELGILVSREGGSPFRSGDVRRIRLVLACERAGLSLGAIGQAVAAGKLSFAFLDLSSYARWGTREAKTYTELAEDIGLPLPLVLRAHEALGYQAPSPEEPIRDDAMEILEVVKLAHDAAIPEDRILGVIRVTGDSLRRVAQAEAQAFHDVIEMPLLSSGMDQWQILQAASAAAEDMVPALDRALLGIYKRHQEHAWLEDIVHHVETALDEMGLYERVEKPAAMCFLDLTGYTRLTEERGDLAAASLASNLASVVQDTAQRHDGQAVKWLGDGVMLHFRDPSSGVRSALEMVRTTPEMGLPPAHVGLDAGPVVFQDGDYFGRTVNIAARIAAYAEPGQVLVSDRVVETSRDGLRFRELGPVELKGVTRPVVLHEALSR